ncbi:MAG: phage tail tube protein [Acetanaerobacterium sp.]
MSDIALNHSNILEINITPRGTDHTWAEIKQGFANIAEALNEVLYQASFLGDGGWGSTYVTGGQYTFTLTGKRFFGDPAQDYIFSDEVMHYFGQARETQVRITRQNGTILLWNVTLANTTNSGGDANQAADISVTVHGNGKPQILTGGLLEQLSVVSVAGSTEGGTAVYVNPIGPASGNSYKYHTGATVELPSYDQVLTTGWTTWNGIDEIEAITGSYIVIAEIDTGTNKARKAGRATVTSAE